MRNHFWVLGVCFVTLEQILVMWVGAHILGVPPVIVLWWVVSALVSAVSRFRGTWVMIIRYLVLVLNLLWYPWPVLSW